MSASMEDIFPVSIRKLNRLVSPFSIKCAAYSVTGGVLLYVLDKGDVISVNINDVVSKAEPEAKPIIIQQVNKIYQSSSDKTSECYQGTKIVTLNKDCSLSIFQLSTGDHGAAEATCIATCSRDELQQTVTDASLEEDLIHILTRTGDQVHIIIGQHLLQVTLDGSSTPIHSVAQLQWNQLSDKVVYGKVRNGLIFLLHTSGDVSIHLLSNGQPVGHVTWSDYFASIYPSFNADELKSANLACIDVTPDLQYLIITFHATKYSILKISLNEYFQLLSSHLWSHSHDSIERQQSVSGKVGVTSDEDEVDYTRDGRPVSEVGAPGNRSWRNLLASAKEIVKKKDKFPEKTGSIWKAMEESERNKNWFHQIHGLNVQCKQDQSVMNRIKRPHESQVITALKKRKLSRDDTLWSRSATLDIAEDNTSKASYIFKIPKSYRENRVGGVSVNGSSVLVWYHSKGESSGTKHGGVCIIDVVTNSMATHNFTEPSVLAGSDEYNHPPLLVTSSDVGVLACNVHQESLVNMLMIYKSASIAETLCLQNSWDHCSIPIHALEVGLRHRQLDTVAFYLKSRENVFQVRQPSSSPAASPTYKQPTSSSVTSDLTQLWLAIDLLMTSIRDNIKEPQSRQYSMQLLHLTLGYQTRLIQDAVEAMDNRHQGSGLASVEGPSDEDLKEFLAKLTSYVAELRLFLKECPEWLKKAAISEDKIDGSEETISISEDTCLLQLISTWKSMEPQEIIKDAILNRRLPLLQAYLRQTGVSGFELAGLPSKMSGLISTGLDAVLDALLVADLDKACGMLRNMGYGVNAELKKICLFTANNGLRDFLINYLSKLGEFSKEEEETIAFVNQLERLYACQSFEKAKSIAMEGNKGAWSEQSIPKIPENSVAQEFLDSTINTGELVSAEAPNCENFNYAHIILDWVKHWDQETRQRILIEKLLSARNKDTPIQYPISEESLWNYLSTHSEWAYIQQWIDASFLLPGQQTGIVGWNQALPQTLGPEAADQLQCCTTNLRERVLNELARRGVFSSAEFSSLNSQLHRLAANNLLFSKPFAIPMVLQEGGTSSVQKFNQQFMEYCVKEQLPSVLYLFLDYYKLCQSENDVINMQLPFVNGQWLEMMLHFRWVARQIADPSLMFQASLSNGRLLLRVAQPSVTALLEANQPIVALATLMYAPGTLSQAMTPVNTSDDKLWKVLPGSLKEALRPYPKLQAAIFSPQDTDGVSTQDITVYQLLQGNVAFDPTKLFQWQPTNNLAAKSGKPSEMQHFSQPDLVRQFAYHEEFKFSYYLYRGRPSFAFVAFLASQLREDGTISRRRISHAYFKAYTTALRHFTNHSIAAACVAFVEMLGRDSLPLRIDLMAAITVCEFEKEDVPERNDDKRTIEEKLVSDLMHSLKGSKSNAELIAERLSSALSSKLRQERIAPYSWDASDTWVLAILYSRLHKLALPTAYLDQCAMHNQWLHFTCFAQAQQYPKDQILELVKKFESSTVREHLQDAFENLQYGSGSDTSRQKTQKGWTRDVRSQYYLKMGVFRRSQSASSRGSVSENSDFSDGGSANVSEDYGSLDESSFQADIPKDLDIRKVDQDLFAIIFSCNSTVQPWRSLLAHSVLLWQPTLAVIASCYQDALIIDCLATWLLTSMSNQSAASKVMEHVPSLQWHSWSLLELKEVIIAALETGDITLLVKGFFTFDPECTLNHLLNFCECFTTKKNFLLAKRHLKEFHTDMLKCRRQQSLKNIPDPFSNPGQIQADLGWCQETSCHIVEIMFAMCQTNWDISKLLQLLAEGDFSLIISRLEPDYNKLHKICQLLQGTPIQLDIKSLLKTKPIHFKEECQKVVEVLQQEKLFSKAKEFAELCRLPRDKVAVFQLQCELDEIKKSKVWKIESGRITFWRSCHMTLKKNRVQGRAAHQFFMDQVSDTATLTAQETVTLLTYAHQWLAKQSKGNQTEELQELECKMWQWKLKAEVEMAESESNYSPLFGDAIPYSNSDQLKDEMYKAQGASELLYVASHEVGTSQKPKLTDDKEISALNRILSQLLEQGCIIQAHRLATQFQYPYQDLSIILTCIQLALGKTRPLGLGAEMQKMLRGKATKPQMARRLSQAVEMPRRPLAKTMSYKLPGTSEHLYVASHEIVTSQKPKLTDDKEISALNRILSQLLEQGCIIQAHRLATQFQYPYQDLSIILTCIQLALGKTRPLGLGAEMQKMLRGKATKPQMARRLSQAVEMPRRPLAKTMSLLSMSSMSLDQPMVDETQLDEVLNTMQELAQHCTGNTMCCNRIINIYAIAQVLQRSYEAVVTSPPFDILKIIFMSASSQRFTLAKTFIRSNGLKDVEVAGFLSGIVLSGLQTRTGRRREGLAARPSLILEISSDREEFSHMIRLCKDPAILGNRLLEEVNQLAGSEIAQNKQVLTMQVELIIRAHDCHTLCCNTEGICSVLRVCRDCSTVLQQAGEFNHLARLLIGVGRYNEMTYIFDTLRAHQQIEMLLKRGTKDDKLKVALLDYLKRCDPPDTETYSAVAVKFEMNREIGELVERDAKQNLKALAKRAMDTNIELQNSLQVVLQDFTKAAEHYAKDNCLRHAERCIKQARLVALQLHLLPMRKRVINLDTGAVAVFVQQHSKFYEAHIVSHAYHIHPEWSVSLYHNVVEQGDLMYFEDYRACTPINESIFREVAARFKREGSRNAQAISNMKTLLGYCQDVLMAYKIATELGFQDVARELLEGEAGAYLRDVA